MVWDLIVPGVYELKPGARLTDEQIDGRITLSHLPRTTQKSHRFSSWKHRAELSTAWDYCYQFTSGIPTKPFLTLSGIPGTGKTHLALAIAWTWLETGKGLVSYYQVETLLDALRRGYDKEKRKPNEDTDTILNYISSCSLAVLDDLGAESTTEWAWKKLDEIVDARYINKLATVITTNGSPGQLSPRIADRLFEGEIIILDSDSYRRRDHSENHNSVQR